jgi:soluble lytic murein transglycosylase
MREVADKCAKLDADTRTWARYYAARAYGRIGQWDESIRQYAKLEAEAPAHSLADDSSYRAALAELENGRPKAAIARLSSIPRRYPEGDMWPRALFKLGWVQLREGDYDNAFERFDQLVERGGDEPQEGITGRANYWRARTLVMMGRRIDAVEAYEEIVKRWPLRYYAQQSLWRLGEIDPARAKAALAEMRSSDEPTRMVFAWRDEFDEPAFDRMVELLIVDEITYASSEMSRLHMLGNDVDPKMAVVGAVLLQHAGAETKLSRVIRTHFEDFEGLLPKGEGKLIWEATYPQAFSPLIEDIAGNEGIPSSFVRAIAREESSFDPEAVSWAKAYGLVQLIMPTAKRFASEIGVKATPRTLKKPEVNLRIGARYMAWLWNRLNENPALVPSAYNAGEGAVRRWLEEDASRPLDVFIEEIPYDETRRYTRRVLQTYGVYQWLADERLPELRANLPGTNGPQRFGALD